MIETSRKIEYDLLEKTAKIYHSIARHSMDSFLILDRQCRFLDVNDVYCKLIGYSRKKILAMNISDVEVGEKNNIEKYLQKIEKSGNGRFLTSHRKKKGTVIDFEVSASYEKDLGGLIIVFLHDITKQKINEQKVAHLASFPRLSPSPIIEVDAKGKIMFINNSASAAIQMIGPKYKINAFLPKDVNDIFIELNNDKEKSLFREVTIGDEIFAETIYLTPEYDSMRIYVENITKRKHAETELAKVQEGLKDKVELQLSDSYKHLGTINRKISLLLELDKYPKSKKDKQKAIDHILNLAMNISEAPTGYLYSSKGRGKFNLLAHRGLTEQEKEKIKVISSRSVGLLRYLLKKKSIISGDIKRYEAKLLTLDNKLDYFIKLPLAKGRALGGFIFLGFNKKENVDAQDLEFLDVFATHASVALINAGVLE